MVLHPVGCLLGFVTECWGDITGIPDSQDWKIRLSIMRNQSASGLTMVKHQMTVNVDVTRIGAHLSEIQSH
jgi:hypothetical protein